MKINLTFIYLTLMMISCSNKFNGKIENRGGQSYLVNTSASKSFQFTVKKTAIKDDSTYSYSTELIILSPGDEKLLGNNVLEQVETIEMGEDRSIQFFTPSKKFLNEKSVRENKLNPAVEKSIDDKIFDDLMKERTNDDGYDTLVEGKQMKYRYIYTQKPPIEKIHKIQIMFEITGQINVKD